MQGLVVALALMANVAPEGPITPSQTARLASAAQIVQEIESGVPAGYRARARCVAVVPDLKKASFILGGEYGKGVMSCRAGDGWSAPMFIQLAKGSWGLEIGVEEIDVVLLVMNEAGVQRLLEDRVTLGADATIAAGPVGRQGELATDAAMTAEIVSYSHAGGLFAGIDLSGSVLRPDGDANTQVYGPRATPRTILATREISAPTQAHGFLTALRTHSAAAPAATDRDAAAVPAATSGTKPAAQTPITPASDDDLRARVVDIQQALDRILADTTPPPVGAGAAAPRTVTVDRARLLQIRAELDALLAALNRR